LPDLKLDDLSDERERRAAAGQGAQARPATAADAIRAWARTAVAIAGPRALWRDHRLFTILAAASLLPRILAALAFRPALLTADSFLYMQEAAGRTLGQIRPAGYAWFLSLLQHAPHPLPAVTTIQHLMGIAVAAIGYGLLRYWGLPAWGAALAAAPTLFDTRQIALESYILPDTLYCLAIMVVVVLLLTKRTPGLWRCALAGLLLAYVAVLRGNGFPVALAVAAYLLIRRVGWRAITAGAVAFAVPVLGYVLAFHAAYGQFNLTSSDGIFLWSRTTSFANCAIIKPPADLRPLCPNRSARPPVKAPAWSISALVGSKTPADYLWASDAWWRHDAHPGINGYNDKLGRQFAVDAIKAQPLDYLRVSARDVLLVFLANDRPQTTDAMAFTAAPRIPVLPSYYAKDISMYAGAKANTHAVQPYAYFMYLYQLPVYFPGVAFFGVLVTGLIGIIRKWRLWGGPAALPWVIAMLSVVLPALLTQSFYRYTLVAIPLACLAAGLAFVRHGPQYSAATAGPAPAAAGPGPATTPAAAGPASATSPAAPAPTTPRPPETAGPAPATTPATPAPTTPRPPETAGPAPATTPAAPAPAAAGPAPATTPAPPAPARPAPGITGATPATPGAPAPAAPLEGRDAGD
jgi:hypothetical protein